MDVSKLGIKQINLSRNQFGDKFCEQLSLALKADEYLKSICLAKNQIGISGFKYLAEACFQHPGLLSIDLRGNPGYSLPETAKFKKIMKNVFFQNLKHEIECIKQFNTRININWIFPDALGLEKNQLDSNLSSVNPDMKRSFFVELINTISKTLKIKWFTVLRAFIGDPNENNLTLNKQLASIKRNKRSSGARNSRSGSAVSIH